MRLSEYIKDFKYEGDNKYYSCKLLFKEIILTADLRMPSLTIIWILVFIRIFGFYLISFLPIPGFTAPEDMKLMQWNDYLFYSAELNLNIFLVGVNYMFISIGIIDYKRKLTSSRIVNSLINPVKDKRFPYLQMFPTINLADRRSLYSWLQIRTSLLDFGQKFSLRV